MINIVEFGHRKTPTRRKGWGLRGRPDRPGGKEPADQIAEVTYMEVILGGTTFHNYFGWASALGVSTRQSGGRTGGNALTMKEQTYSCSLHY
jgi:hypothetical protein